MHHKKVLLSIFLLIIFNQTFSNEVKFYDLDRLKIENNISAWLQVHLDKEEELYSNDSVGNAENILDSALLNAWRKPVNKEENDLFFRINWYKAFYQKDNGNMVNAKHYFEQSLKNYKNSSKKYKEDLIIIYAPLGNIYTILGDNKKAIFTHKSMISTIQSLEDYDQKNDDLAVAYTNLSIVFESQNDLNLAIETIKKAISLSQISDYNQAIAQSNYGKYLYQKDHLKKATIHLEKAKKLFLKSNNFDSYFLGGIHRTLAFIFKKLNQKKIANQYLDLAIKNYKDSNTIRNREISKTYLEKSKLSPDKTELLNIALQYLIPHEKTFPNEYFPSKDLLFAENTLADIFAMQTKLPLSSDIILDCYEMYFEVQKMIREEHLFKNSKQQNLISNHEITSDAISFCQVLYSKTKNEKYAQKALEFIENEKSILLFESLVQKNTNSFSENYHAYLSRKKSLVNQMIHSQLNNDIKATEKLEQEIEKLDIENEINNLKDENLEFQDFQIETYQESLKKGEALLVFHQSLDLYLILLTNDTKSIYKVDSTNTFMKELKLFSTYFNFKNRFHFDAEIARSLGEKLNSFIPKNTNKIYLVTDGLMNNIPLEAFKIGSKYFIEKYEIQNIFSANIKQNIRYNKTNNKQVLAIAPIFENDKLKHLRSSQEEVENVLKEIKGNSLLRKEANIKNFISLAKKYTILHISSHAQIDQKLQTASIDFFDESLYFSQIQQEKFETQLLVLSACETGIGKETIGEGSLSLSKAFAYSNIPSIISSLWKINEKSTSIIFEKFYEKIVEKKSISTALRESKIAYLQNESIDLEKKYPYYWASFIIIGNDSVLELEKAHSVNILLIIIIVFLLVSRLVIMRNI